MKRSSLQIAHLLLYMVVILVSSTGFARGPIVDKAIEAPSLLMDTTPPNILLIIADDLGLDPVPGYPGQGTKASMPHLQQLMSEGITFDRFWSNPSCTPTRASILTGKYGRETGVLMPGDRLSGSETSLHEYLNAATNGLYSSSLIGKWHLNGGGNNNSSYPEDSLGIPYFAGLLGGGVQAYDNWSFTDNGVTTTSLTYVTTTITDLAIDWINDQTSPWFCWLAYNAPHAPFHEPPAHMHQQGNLSDDPQVINNNPLPYYLAMVESVDFEIGRLMDNIPADELDNTVIIFIGDNGTPRAVIQDPFSRRQGKGSLYQGGINVPMIISGHGVTRQNEREDALVTTTDLFATIAKLAGDEVNQIHDSHDFSFLLNDATSEGLRQCSYTDSRGDTDVLHNWAASDSEYKLIVTEEQTVFELYHLITDPYESMDLNDGSLSDTEQEAFDQLMIGCETIITKAPDISLDAMGLGLFPNPVMNELTINGQLSDYNISIFDAMGQLFDQLLTVAHSNTIDLSSLPSGLYIIRFEHKTNHQLQVELILKE